MGEQQRVDLVGRLIRREVADARQDLEPIGPDTSSAVPSAAARPTVSSASPQM